MRILVTGGAGFIGSHLCERLAAEGHKVTAVDNFITGSRENIEHLLSLANFELVEFDVVKPMDSGPWDTIYHLASPASPVGYWQHPLETLLVNSTGTYHILELALRWGAKFLLTSTSEVYGDPLEHPQRESYWGNVNPVGPRACYDEGKRFAEAITDLYIQKRGLDGRIVRIFNTYGQRNRLEDGRIIPNFITQALSGKPITVYGDGSQTRSLCYVADMVEGISRAMDHPGTSGQVINLGNPDERSVLEIATLVKNLTDSPSPIHRLPGREEEVKQRCPDISRAKELLGWDPKTDLEVGLLKTIAWVREQMAMVGTG